MSGPRTTRWIRDGHTTRTTTRSDRLELGAVIVAPLFEPGADVIGTLAITYREPRPIDPRDVTLLEELARQASIAARNARLYAELRDRTSALETSESRYRNLVDHSPDLVWAVDGDGRLTYIGETLERLTGFPPDTVMGRPLGHPAHARLESSWRVVSWRGDPGDVPTSSSSSASRRRWLAAAP